MPVNPACPPIAEEARRLRAILLSDPAGLLAEFLPAHVARAAAGDVLDFGDWSQFNQWPQAY